MAESVCNLMIHWIVNLDVNKNRFLILLMFFLQYAGGVPGKMSNITIKYILLVIKVVQDFQKHLLGEVGLKKKQYLLLSCNPLGGKMFNS